MSSDPFSKSPKDSLHSKKANPSFPSDIFNQGAIKPAFGGGGGGRARKPRRNAISMKKPLFSAWIKLLIGTLSITLLVNSKVFSSPRVDVELDPTDFILGGYRIHAGYIQNSLRYDLGILSVKIPKLFHENDRFDYEIFGVVARVDYLFDTYKKWFVGIEGTWMKNTYTHIPTNVSETRRPFLLATRIGYRFVFFDHLTVTPWIGLGALFNKGSEYVVVDSDKFKVSTFNIFPTVHIGWAF